MLVKSARRISAIGACAALALALGGEGRLSRRRPSKRTEGRACYPASRPGRARTFTSWAISRSGETSGCLTTRSSRTRIARMPTCLLAPSTARASPSSTYATSTHLKLLYRWQIENPALHKTVLGALDGKYFKLTAATTTCSLPVQPGHARRRAWGGRRRRHRATRYEQGQNRRPHPRAQYPGGFHNSSSTVTRMADTCLSRPSTARTRKSTTWPRCCR